MTTQLLNRPIPVQYQNGILKILIKLPLENGEKFNIEILKPRKKTLNKKPNFITFKKALERSFGIAPDLQDGTQYTQEIRKEWESEIKRKWHE